MISKYSCSTKTFILGEYAVLKGEKALVATTPLRFGLEDGALSTAFVEKSPTGKLVEKLGITLSHRLRFIDPLNEMGGFGASSAQFILAFMAVHQIQDARPVWKDIYTEFRSLTADESVPPSGADIVAQAYGGVISFDSRAQSVEDFSKSTLWDDVLIFSTTHDPKRKTPTHEHLKSLASDALLLERLTDKLREPLELGLVAARENHHEKLGASLKAYAGVIAEFGLESQDAQLDRRFISSLPQVAGVKGSGAMLSDSVVVLIRPDSSVSDRVDLIEALEGRRLRLVLDGLTPGISARRDKS